MCTIQTILDGTDFKCVNLMRETNENIGKSQMEKCIPHVNMHRHAAIMVSIHFSMGMNM